MNSLIVIAEFITDIVNTEKQHHNTTLLLQWYTNWHTFSTNVASFFNYKIYTKMQCLCVDDIY